MIIVSVCRIHGLFACVVKRVEAYMRESESCQTLCFCRMDSWCLNNEGRERHTAMKCMSQLYIVGFTQFQWV